MAITQRRMTLEEFLRLPEEKPALEFMDGVVTQKVSPQGKHGRLQFEGAKLIDGFAAPRRLAMVFTELRATYANASLVADIAVHRWERVPRDADGEVANVFREPPDIAIEIVSPDQSVRELIDKCRWFVDHGAEIALLVDPDRKTVRRFRPGAEPQLLGPDDRIDLDSVLPGFELTVRELFALLRPE